MAENTFVLKLNEGSDIIESIKNLAKKEKIVYGVFISACGKIKETKIIGGSSAMSSEKMQSDEVFVVNAVSGKIQKTSEDNFDIYLRVSVTSAGFSPKVGRLLSGKAADSLEIGIRKVDLKKIIEA